MRCNVAFFLFVSLVESLYIANLTCKNDVAYRTDLITTIDTCIRQSSQVKDRFKVCIGEDASSEDSLILWKWLDEHLLPWYSRMKSRDVVRLIKMYRRPDSDSMLSTRKKSIAKQGK